MSRCGARHAGRLACAALLALLGSGPALGQAPAVTYEVRRGDTLFEIARKTKPAEVNRNQMIVAIFRANPDEFPGGDINILRVGQVLRIPGREQAAALAPADAQREVQALLAPRPAVAPPPAELRVPPAFVAPAKPPAVPLGREEAAKRYREGLALARGGDDPGALRAFLEAGESGHGLAQRKLGEIYDKGNTAVTRDYETALKWYQKAREQGIEIPKPFVRAPR